MVVHGNSATASAVGRGSLTACNFPRAITVPPDEYFVLGENLGASDDSRFSGPVKRQWLVGLVMVG